MTTNSEAAQTNTNAAAQSLAKLGVVRNAQAPQAMFDLGIIQAQTALAISQSLLEITASLNVIARKLEQQ